MLRALDQFLDAQKLKAIYGTTGTMGTKPLQDVVVELLCFKGRKRIHAGWWHTSIRVIKVKHNETMPSDDARNACMVFADHIAPSPKELDQINIGSGYSCRLVWISYPDPLAFFGPILASGQHRWPLWLPKCENSTSVSDSALKGPYPDHTWTAIMALVTAKTAKFQKLAEAG